MVACKRVAKRPNISPVTISGLESPLLPPSTDDMFDRPAFMIGDETSTHPITRSSNARHLVEEYCLESINVLNAAVVNIFNCITTVNAAAPICPIAKNGIIFEMEYNTTRTISFLPRNNSRSSRFRFHVSIVPSDMCTAPMDEGLCPAELITSKPETSSLTTSATNSTSVLEYDSCRTFLDTFIVTQYPVVCRHKHTKTTSCTALGLWTLSMISQTHSHLDESV
mmetsp:Transcript_1587/g.2534  ORF Transcript_1587/g.2534 Transcript_1587/m.2534 type:complete len:224 (-) Transcript_1587:40-711(-)